MIAPAEERLPDLRLTIDIDRPTPENPNGYIGMVAHEKGNATMEDAADGDHSERTLKRVLLDAYSYFHNGRKSYVALVEKTRNERHR